MKTKNKRVTRSKLLSVSVLLLLLISYETLSAYRVDFRINHWNISTCNFSLSKFIDACPNKGKVVGYTRMGISNKEEALELPKDFAAYCDSIFNTGSIKFDAKLRLIPVINQVTVQEMHKEGKEFSMVSLAIDYYIENGDSCKLFFSSFAKTQVSNGFDITKKHARNLSSAFQKTFLNLNNFISSKTPPLGNFKIKTSDLPGNLSTNKTMQPALKDGLYFNCRQLINNIPDLNYNTLLSKVDTSNITIEFSKNDLFFKQNLFFAFVKNRVLYVQVNGLSYRKAGFEADKRRIYYENLVLRDGLNMSLGLGLMFGIPGLIAGTIIDNSTPAKMESKGRLYQDLESGLVDIRP